MNFNINMLFSLVVMVLALNADEEVVTKKKMFSYIFLQVQKHTY